MSNTEASEPTYSLGTTVRLTGLSPELLRAWERRYGVVEPLRTPGGTRRYRASDLERLRLVKSAVDAGHRIGRVAHLADVELRDCASGDSAESPTRPLDAMLAALERLDAGGFQHLLGVQFAALGPREFTAQVASPLVVEIGRRWADGRLNVACEHLATAGLRSTFGAAMQPTARSLMGPRIVFGTPANERHELGLMMAALSALGAGANVVYLGADLPAEEILRAVETTGAAALAISIVTLPAEDAKRSVAALRGGLPDHVPLWLGGAGATNGGPGEGIEQIPSLQALEQRVALLCEQAS